jgi:hypothetical protein
MEYNTGMRKTDIKPSASCRVCGFRYENDYYPWGEDGNSPSYDICICCGAEFGFDDDTPENVSAYRKKWIDAGTPFHSPSQIPTGWLPDEHFNN